MAPAQVGSPPFSTVRRGLRERRLWVGCVGSGPHGGGPPKKASKRCRRNALFGAHNHPPILLSYWRRSLPDAEILDLRGAALHPTFSLASCAFLTLLRDSA
jgi:hypothetical protein